MSRSRWMGVLIGGLGGATIGMGVMYYLYGLNLERVGWGIRIIAALIVGAIGALLGGISGFSRD